jgi:hypothetical protein
MGSGASFVIVPFMFYVALMLPFCVKVAQASSARVGWMMAAVLIFSPLALLVAAGVP